MVKHVQLSFALLILSSVLIIGCSQADPPAQTPGNSNPQPSTSANSPADPRSNAPVSDPAAANRDVLPPPVVNSNAAARAPANTNIPTATIRARNVKATAGREVTLEIELESKEDITVMVFSLDFDPAVFTYVSSKLSPGVPKAAVLTVNAEQTAAGKFGALIDSSTAFTIGKKAIMTVVFRVAADAPARDYQINFSSKPARQSTSNIKTQLVDTKFEPATVSVVASR
ncbi:MAG: cohesin domain-containing protein [Pyrinomonadaceae bacterium]